MGKFVGSPTQNRINDAVRALDHRTDSTTKTRIKDTLLLTNLSIVLLQQVGLATRWSWLLYWYSYKK